MLDFKGLFCCFFKTRAFFSCFGVWTTQYEEMWRGFFVWTLFIRKMQNGLCWRHSEDTVRGFKVVCKAELEKRVHSLVCFSCGHNSPSVSSNRRSFLIVSENISNVRSFADDGVDDVGLKYLLKSRSDPTLNHRRKMQTSEETLLRMGALAQVWDTPCVSGTFSCV